MSQDKMATGERVKLLFRDLEGEITVGASGRGLVGLVVEIAGCKVTLDFPTREACKLSSELAYAAVDSIDPDAMIDGGAVVSP